MFSPFIYQSTITFLLFISYQKETNKRHFLSVCFIKMYNFLIALLYAFNYILIFTLFWRVSCITNISKNYISNDKLNDNIICKEMTFICMYHWLYHNEKSCICIYSIYLVLSIPSISACIQFFQIKICQKFGTILEIKKYMTKCVRLLNEESLNKLKLKNHDWKKKKVLQMH